MNTKILALVPVLLIANMVLAVDLIVGQNIDVGDVSVWDDGNKLYVNYQTDDEWCLLETHLAVDEIPQTKSGGVKVGKFEYVEEHECVFDYMYEIDIDSEWENPVDIAAHTVVGKVTGYVPLDFELPDSVSMKVLYPAPQSYFEAVIWNSNIDGNYESWCVDTDKSIFDDVEHFAYVYSSYESLPAGLIEYPENLDLVNWIINQDYVGKISGCCGLYTYGDVQRATWSLIEDQQSTAGLGLWNQNRVDEILTAVYVNGEGFIPECKQDIVVILQPFLNDVEVQTVTIQLPLPCKPVYSFDETAWGDGTSFSKSWATYFTYEFA